MLCSIFSWYCAGRGDVYNGHPTPANDVGNKSVTDKTTICFFSLLLASMCDPTDSLPFRYLSESNRDGCNCALQALGASCTEIVVPKHDAAMALARLDGFTYNCKTNRDSGTTRENARGRRGGRKLGGVEEGTDDAVVPTSHLSSAKMMSVHS